MKTLEQMMTETEIMIQICKAIKMDDVSEVKRLKLILDNLNK